MSNLTLRLTADVAYDTNGTSPKALCENLHAAFMNEYANGALTSGDGVDAEIADIDVRVDTVLVAGGGGGGSGQGAGRSKLWAAIVEHTVLPGPRLFLFHQSERPSRAAILERAKDYLPENDQNRAGDILSVRSVMAQELIVDDAGNARALASLIAQEQLA